jgi:hypothetical protein
MVNKPVPKTNLKKPLGSGIVEELYSIQRVSKRAALGGALSALSHQTPELGAR